MRVVPGGSACEPVRIRIPGRELPDITDAEGAALYRRLGAHLIQRGNSPIMRHNA
ncbi:hypothetical protein [Embleya scabrispora]|uniref:hypothetical protein n=1 Tax=Embleya scabrispora TaxID=159449 RepID=UPI00036456EA|nr:hypothetical protein [Embleya scabrispora]MYS82447.1 hypothetical protein [Streptomyces sp. SID5474]